MAAGAAQMMWLLEMVVMAEYRVAEEVAAARQLQAERAGREGTAHAAKSG